MSRYNYDEQNANEALNEALNRTLSSMERKDGNIFSPL
jgi:hypothetical protein